MSAMLFVLFVLGAALGFFFGAWAMLAHFSKPHSCKYGGHRFSPMEVISDSQSDYATCADCGERVNLMEKL